MKEERRNQFLLTVALAFMLIMIPGRGWAAMPADTRMSINVKSVSVEQVLDEIHRQAKLDFFYDASQAKNWPKVTLKLTNQTARDIIS